LGLYDAYLHAQGALSATRRLETNGARLVHIVEKAMASIVQFRFGPRLPACLHRERLTSGVPDFRANQASDFILRYVWPVDGGMNSARILYRPGAVAPYGFLPRFRVIKVATRSDLARLGTI